MKVSTKSFPYPVLGNKDDMKGRFNPAMKVTLEANKVILDCSMELANETVESLIADGTASFYIQVECASTFYRHTFTSNELQTRIEIDAGELRDKVTVAFLICTNQVIEEYSPIGVHPDLEGEPSYVEKGDIIADGGSGWFIADKTFDPLKAPISSFMKIMVGTNKKGPMTINYGDDSIIIVLSKDDYEKYYSVRNFAPNILHSVLVFPALIDALYTMQKNKAQYEDSPWFSKIQQITLRNGVDVEDPVHAAQQLLGQPIGRSLAEINKISETEED